MIILRHSPTIQNTRVEYEMVFLVDGIFGPWFCLWGAGGFCYTSQLFYVQGNNGVWLNRMKCQKKKKTNYNRQTSLYIRCSDARRIATAAKENIINDTFIIYHCPSQGERMIDTHSWIVSLGYFFLRLVLFWMDRFRCFEPLHVQRYIV